MRHMRTWTAVAGLAAGLAVGTASLQAATASEPQIRTLNVVPELGVEYVLTCRTFEGPHTIKVCLPDESPFGGSIQRVEEDASARYDGGVTFSIDDETVVEGTTTGTWRYDDEDFGAGGGAVCGTDAQCAAWSRAHGEEPTGYAAGK